MKSTTKFLAMALGFATVSASMAQTPVPVNQEPIDIYPSGIQQLDSNGHPYGPIMPMDPTGGETPMNMIIERAYDGRHMSTDGLTTTNQGYSTSMYSGNVVFTAATTNALLNWPMFVNDMTVLAPGSLGKVSQRTRVVMGWAPAGGTLGSLGFSFNTVTTPYLGCVDVWSVGKFSDGVDGFVYQELGQGYRYFFGGLTTGLASGFYNLNITNSTATAAPFPSNGFGTPLPTNGNGGFMYIFRKAATTSLTVSNLSGAEVAFPGFRSMASPTDPVFPGTNPSDSSQFAWVDENASYGFSTTEYSDWDDISNPPDPLNDSSRLSPVHQAHFDSAAQLAQVTVNLNNYAGGGSLPVPTAITVQLAPYDTVAGDVYRDVNGAPIVRTVTYFRDTTTGLMQILDPKIDPDGTGPIVAPTTYKIMIKRNHWLKKDLGVVNFASLSAITANLTNGDCNDDNEIGPGDFTLLSTAFGALFGDPTYNANADLNEDDEVGPADFTILSTNFGTSGDDF